MELFAFYQFVQYDYKLDMLLAFCKLMIFATCIGFIACENQVAEEVCLVGPHATSACNLLHNLIRFTLNTFQLMPKTLSRLILENQGSQMFCYLLPF